jgi:septal ring factor EnvC (AmiA/AmiB activator)
LLYLFFLSPTYAVAQTADPQKSSQAMADKKLQDEELKKQLDKTEYELAELRLKLVAAANQQQRSEEELLSINTALDELQKKAAIDQKSLHDQQGRIGGVLLALLRVARTPPETVLLKPDAPLDNIRSALLLRRALPFYTDEANRLSAQLNELDKTRLAIVQKQQDALTAQKSFTEHQDNLTKLLAERQKWLQATQNQRDDLQKQINALSLVASNVQELVSKVTQVKTSGLQLVNKQKKSGPPTFMSPSKGRILYNFGDIDDVGSGSRGITMRVKGGDMIVAPADGQIVFAGPFKGYGNILIIRHAQDYHSFLAGFGRVDARIGQTVNEGEPLGRTSLEEGNRNQLYYELRYKGTPTNPLKHMTMTNIANNSLPSSSQMP